MASITRTQFREAIEYGIARVTPGTPEATCSDGFIRRSFA
jgi:hypothetical protein